MHEPSEDEIGAAMARFTELSEAMPGGLTMVEDAGTLARIVNALPPQTEVMFDDAVRGAPRWWQAPDPVITGVARLS